METLLSKMLSEKLLVIRACEHVARDAMENTHATTQNYHDVQNAMTVIVDNARQVLELIEKLGLVK